MIRQSAYLVAALLFFVAVSSLPAAQPPNILLIVSDDQGYNDLGCYGGEEIKTPNLDRLAEEGTRLSDFSVTWPACTPTRASITGPMNAIRCRRCDAATG